MGRRRDRGARYQARTLANYVDCPDQWPAADATRRPRETDPRRASQDRGEGQGKGGRGTADQRQEKLPGRERAASTAHVHVWRRKPGNYVACAWIGRSTRL